MRCQPLIKWFFSRAFFWYALALVIVLWLSVPGRAVIDRMNAVGDWGEYPARLAQGKEPYNERSLRMAVRYFKLESLFLPLNAQPLTMAGYCYASLGDTTNALKYFLLARNKSPGHFWIDHDLGLLYYRAKDLDRAYAAFQRVIQRDMPSLFEAAVLSPMTRTPASQRKVLVAVATDFAVQLKGKSYQMKVMIDFERQLYPQAMTTALAAVEDPLIQNKSLFLLYAGAAAYRAGYFEQAVQLGRFALDKDKRNEWAKALLILSVASLSGSMAEDAVFFERFTGDPGLFPRNTAVVLHPWAAYILPGKEAYL